MCNGFVTGGHSPSSLQGYINPSGNLACPHGAHAVDENGVETEVNCYHYYNVDGTYFERRPDGIEYFNTGRGEHKYRLPRQPGVLGEPAWVWIDTPAEYIGLPYDIESASITHEAAVNFAHARWRPQQAML